MLFAAGQLHDRRGTGPAAAQRYHVAGTLGGGGEGCSDGTGSDDGQIGRSLAPGTGQDGPGYPPDSERP